MARKPPSNNSTATIGFEAKLWLTADKLRNNMDAAEYKHVVLGLIFLKYISDTFEEHRAKLLAGQGDYAGANAEDPDEPRGARQPAAGSPKGQRGGAEQYKAENVFWVPSEARWSHLQASAKQPNIGKTVDAAMVAIERDNPRLKGVIPKDYARPGLDKQRFGQLINVIATIELTAASEDEKTHRSVEMLAPYKGRIHDPACGSGGISIYGQDKWARRQRPFGLATRARRVRLRRQQQKQSNTTRSLAVMNLALRGIEADLGPDADTVRRDLHPALRADYVLANPAVRKANNPEMAQPRLK